MATIIKGKKDNTRRFKGGGPRPDLKEFKRAEAAERQKTWDALTIEQKLATLDKRPGNSLKQRAKLKALLEKEPVQAAEQQPQAPERPRQKAKDRRSAERHEKK